MRWRKHGQIYSPDEGQSWSKSGCLTPTPILIGDTIRVYASFRDASGIGRIGYVDVAASNPSHIIRVSEAPVLDVGQPGCFDDNGIILGDVVPDGEKIRMYYVGFQKVARAKFLAFSGLAVSHDGGDSFSRLKKSPILDRSDEGLYIRAIHAVLPENGKWRIWYSAGDGWETIEGNLYPRYHIRHQSSIDGIHFSECGDVCLKGIGNEYRLGRGRIYPHPAGYQMLFTKGTPDGSYTPGYATSPDGLHWQRDDAALGISLSDSGWDSRHLFYPTLIQYQRHTWMFYNGNDMGADGFGYAELIEP